MGTQSLVRQDDETGMIVLGFLILFDPPKSMVNETIGELKGLGVSLKVITGDNSPVAAGVVRHGGVLKITIANGGKLPAEQATSVNLRRSCFSAIRDPAGR